MESKLLFLTNPHGAQAVYEIYDDEDPPTPRDLGPNSMIKVVNERGIELVFTGWELDSLAVQWIAERLGRGRL